MASQKDSSHKLFWGQLVLVQLRKPPGVFGKQVEQDFKSERAEFEQLWL